jgi:hypothetical protein
MANGIPALVLLASLSLAPPAALVGQETAAPEAAARRVGVIFGGAFESFDIVGPLDGAKRTKMAAHYEWDFGVRPFSEEVWKQRGMDWARFFAAAKALADEIAARVKPKLVRDHRGVVLYAVVADEDPFLTGAVLSPKLRERFRETLGDRIHAVLLERNRLYLFPATGGALADFGPSLVEEYRRARFPVSLEILLLDHDGIRVVGELARDAAAPRLPNLPDPPESEGDDDTKEPDEP